MGPKKILQKHVSRSVQGIAVGWILFSVVLPLSFVFWISLAQPCLDTPPYTSILQSATRGVYTFVIGLTSYQSLTLPLYVLAYGNALTMAFFTTVGCLFLGYPLAYGLTICKPRQRAWCVLMLMIPFTTPFILRLYAWVHLLAPEGIFHHIALYLGLTPCNFMGHSYAVILGMIYGYLPFMVLPLYVALEKISPDIIEAAYDLGAKKRHAFWHILLPLSKNGISVGSLMVFIAALGDYVVPELLGGYGTLTLGQVLWSEFFYQKDWPLVCAMTLSVMGFLGPFIAVFHRMHHKLEE